jgi:ABC-2 type transport system ATP-binding protein
MLPDGRLAVSDVTTKTVADLALAAGVSVYGIQEERADLEQLFLQLTSGMYAAQPPPGYVMPPGFPPQPPPGYPPFQQQGFQQQPGQQGLGGSHL